MLKNKNIHIEEGTIIRNDITDNFIHFSKIMDASIINIKKKQRQERKITIRHTPYFHHLYKLISKLSSSNNN